MLITARASRIGQQVRQTLRLALPTLLVAIGVLVLWEVLIVLLNIQQFLLPKPSVILAEFLGEVRLYLAPESTSLLFDSTGATFREALGGFFLGCGSGILVALITARWTVVSEATMPFAIAANSVPIIAFAPIMNNWFGITNPCPKCHRRDHRFLPDHDKHGARPHPG